MGKKLLALALVGAAAWLFKTKQGKEVRGKIGNNLNDMAGKAKDVYTKYKGKYAEPVDA